MCDPLSIYLVPLWVNMAGDSGFLKELRVQLKSLFPIESIPKQESAQNLRTQKGKKSIIKENLKKNEN